MASYGIQVQMYIDDKPTGRVFNHSTTSSTISALYPNVDKPDGPVIETKMLGMTNSEYATTIAKNVYNTIKTYLYSPYKASDAILDLAMELVDGLTINEWTTVGYVGAATGIDASGNTTRGAVLKSVDRNSYVIATNAGVRMQQGNTGFWIADNAISYRIGGGSVTPLGYAVFS